MMYIIIAGFAIALIGAILWLVDRRVRANHKVVYQGPASIMFYEAERNHCLTGLVGKNHRIVTVLPHAGVCRGSYLNSRIKLPLAEQGEVRDVTILRSRTGRHFVSKISVVGPLTPEDTVSADQTGPAPIQRQAPRPLHPVPTIPHSH